MAGVRQAVAPERVDEDEDDVRRRGGLVGRLLPHAAAPFRSATYVLSEKSTWKRGVPFVVAVFVVLPLRRVSGRLRCV
jgi:hypothetical protein